MARVRARIGFFDRVEACGRAIDDEFECSAERAAELAALGLVEMVPQQEEPAEQQDEKPAARKAAGKPASRKATRGKSR